jgi:hypothetical protein
MRILFLVTNSQIWHYLWREQNCGVQNIWCTKPSPNHDVLHWITWHTFPFPPTTLAQHWWDHPIAFLVHLVTCDTILGQILLVNPCTLVGWLPWQRLVLFQNWSRVQVIGLSLPLNTILRKILLYSMCSFFHAHHITTIWMLLSHNFHHNALCSHHCMCSSLFWQTNIYKHNNNHNPTKLFPQASHLFLITLLALSHALYNLKSSLGFQAQWKVHL